MELLLKFQLPGVVFFSFFQKDYKIPLDIFSGNLRDPEWLKSVRVQSRNKAEWTHLSQFQNYFQSYPNEDC